MKRQAIAFATASTIALTSLSNPVQAATDEEVFMFVAGLAALAIIANAASSSTPPAPSPTPAPAPVTHSTGPIVVPQTYRFNLDNGNIGGAGADMWFQAVTPIKMFLKPRNGAKMAVGDRSNRGYAGCSVASYSGARVNINALPVGSYVCVKTNQGRISQFRVNALTPGYPKKLKLGYTTWQ